MNKVDGEISLSMKEREKLHKCPNCSSETFRTFLAERQVSKKHPLPSFRKGRPVVQCVSCGYWTDLFGDQLTWRSAEVLQK